MTQAPSEQFCGYCSEDRAAGAHARCDRAALLEPPRYCVACRRRMVVQVTPTGWTARCSRHGEVTGAQR
jgi:hypothetical protein